MISQGALLTRGCFFTFSITEVTQVMVFGPWDMIGRGWLDGDMDDERAGASTIMNYLNQLKCKKFNVVASTIRRTKKQEILYFTN